ncbi:MAG TPA: EamA family transporter [Nordella sp.]|nr:EamA family transporter [Nordella sp.]
MATETSQPNWIAAASASFVVIWATGFIVARLSAPHVEPLSFLTVRFSIAGVMLVLLAFAFKARWPNRSAALHAFIAGTLLHGGYLGACYWAVAHCLPAGIAALIAGLQPIFTAILAGRFLGERITPRHWLGLSVALAGVALVLAPKLDVSVVDGITPATVFAMTFGALSMTLGSIYQKRFVTHIDLLTGTAWQYAGAFLVVLAGALLTESFRFDATADAWIALGWSVIVLSIGAILLLMALIKHGSVSKVSALIFLVPGVAAVMAWGLFGETLTLIQILGMIVCALGVLLVTRRRR